MMNRSYILLVAAFLKCLFLLPPPCCTAFVLTPARHPVGPNSSFQGSLLHPRTSRSTKHHQAYNNQENDNSNPWLQEFSIATGEVINPYRVLKVHRTADRTEIRASYVTLSRRFHPDAVAHRNILPGSCNNLDDVREQWERIKLSYEILKDPKRRKKYDRHEAIADPGAAVQRAAVDAAFKGIAGIGKGLFGMGVSAVQQLSSTKKRRSATPQTQEATVE